MSNKEYQNNLPAPTPEARFVASDDSMVLEAIAPALRAYRGILEQAHVNQKDIVTLMSSQILSIMDENRRPYMLDALQSITGAIPLMPPSPTPEVPIILEPLKTTKMETKGDGDMEQSVEYQVSQAPSWNKYTKRGIPKGPGRYRLKNGK